MDTEAFDFVLGIELFGQHPEILSLRLQAPSVLLVDHGDGTGICTAAADSADVKLPEGVQGYAIPKNMFTPKPLNPSPKGEVACPGLEWHSGPCPTLT